MNALSRFLGRHSDVAMVLALLGVLLVLFLPIPRGLLDFLILANFSFAFLLLLLTFSMARPVDFSTFPSLLLLATLFRLSLNVAATRLILAEGDAGRVIAAIGSHVVAGNFVVGLIVFFILVVVQYVVVTSGAQRVSEVAARFTLDSMPGQQMSIDADLNMGFIDQAEAQRRRRQLEKEAGFYGAMDGASKFVKGDAVAGILILLINIVGGLVIGVLQHKMPWSQALQTYTLLIIVLSMLRQAIGMPETPPNPVLIGLALFFTLFTMSPVLQSLDEQAFQPFMNGSLGMEAAYAKGTAPLREFMVRQTREQDLALMIELSKARMPQGIEDVGNVQLIPAFMLSELRAAFQIGFMVFLPFLLIDLVVSSVLMALGMMMMPPTTIALPLKVLMFVLVDGWSLVLKALVGSFH